MKTVMKKLLSLALVAILLVSAVPFQAAATDIDDDDDGIEYVTLTVKYDTGAETGSVKLKVEKDTEVEREEVKEALKAKITGYKKFTSNTKFPLLMEKDTTIEVKVEFEHTCDYQTNTKEATCTETGLITKTCKICGHAETEVIPAKGHSWGEWTVTKAATAKEGGEEERVCSTCGATETRTTKPTGEDTYTVKFYADGVVVATYDWAKNETVPTLPTASKKSGYQFKGWYTGKNANGEKLTKGDKWDGTTTYYAYYQIDSTGTKDGVSELEVRMKLYTGSNMTYECRLFVEPKLDDDTYILSWLQKNTSRVREAIYSKVDDSEYEWIDRVFYDNDSEAELTSQDTLADGDKVVFVKVHALASTETNVQLYIHKYNSTSKTYSTLKIVDVSGYKTGDTITLTQMATIVKKSYSYTSIKGLYTNTAWSQLLNGQTPTASTSLTVSGEGTVKYHVVLNGATAASSSSTADTTNPKTGDMIFVPMMVMMASAAAVAFVYMSSKKRAR